MIRQVLALILHVPALYAAIFFAAGVGWLGVSNGLLLTCFAIAIATASAAFLLTRKKLWVVPSAALAASVIFVSVVDVSPVQPASRAVERITVGMTEAQVRRILAQEFPAGGRFTPEGIERPIRNDLLSFALDPSSSKHNASFVSVEFQYGRVARVRYLPD